jgi:hypothetical protein
MDDQDVPTARSPWLWDSAVLDGRPLAIAHGAGNDLKRLKAAEARQVDFVEADVWFQRGAVEVRHHRVWGRGGLWFTVNRWRVAPAWGRQLKLADLVEVSADSTRLMLDLKGVSPQLAPGLVETMRRLAPGRPYAVCSRSWGLLDAFRAHPDVLVVHSVGNEQELRAVRDSLNWHGHHALAVRHELLSRRRVDALHEVAPLLLAWTVDDRSRTEQLLHWGVHGIISNRLDLLQEVVASRTESLSRQALERQAGTSKP